MRKSQSCALSPVLFAAFAGLMLLATDGSAQNADGENAHPELSNSPEITGDDAEAIYQSLRLRMKQGYMLSRLPVAGQYQEWRRYNAVPYLSKSHGNRYLNNYANRPEFDFANPPDGIVYPAGTVLAKDAFSVTDHDDVYPASLFIMEKLEAGASPKTADWRYVAIFPDGSIAGDTTGDMPESVEYCHQCHTLVKDKDYLFGVPSEAAIQ